MPMPKTKTCSSALGLTMRSLDVCLLFMLGANGCVCVADDDAMLLDHMLTQHDKACDADGPRVYEGV